MAVVAMLLALMAMAAGLVELVAAIFIFIHAFQKDVGKGFMVLCIPCYIFYYLHTEFEHEKKQLIMMGFYGGLAGLVVFQSLALGLQVAAAR